MEDIYRWDVMNMSEDNKKSEVTRDKQLFKTDSLVLSNTKKTSNSQGKEQDSASWKNVIGDLSVPRRHDSEKNSIKARVQG